MSLIRPLSALYRKGDIDSNGRVLQLLNAVHRLAVMDLSDSDFKNPLGVSGYYGFGADGFYYEDGVRQRTWVAGDVIDDFTDRVTDDVRWEGVSGFNDFVENGGDYVNVVPVGGRLEARSVYGSSRLFSRKGLMVYTPNNDLGGLSTRVVIDTSMSPVGVNLENCILLCLQQQGVDTEFLFCGYVNTVTYPNSVVYGYYTGTGFVVSGSVALSAGVSEVDIAIIYDAVNNKHRGFYTLDLTGKDYTDVVWNAVGGWENSPATYPVALVPRIYAALSEDVPLNTVYRITDVRVEEGVWVGNQRASWYLEVDDDSNLVDLVGVDRVCPDKVLCVWEHELDKNYLTLIDISDVSDLRLWRRWKSMPVWLNEDYRGDIPFTRGGLSAAEGHIVLSLDTKAQSSTVEDRYNAGEIWLFSLRWDTVLVFTVQDLGVFLLDYDDVTGRIIRDTGSWGARRWLRGRTYMPMGNYFRKYYSAGWVGTMRHKGLESVVPAVTYNVDIKKCVDNKVYIAYGIQEITGLQDGSNQLFAGVIRLDEGVVNSYPRFLFQKDPVEKANWGQGFSDWNAAVLSSNLVVYWTQSELADNYDQLQGVLCRKDFSLEGSDNVSVDPIREDVVWRDAELFGPITYHIALLDSNPVGNEVVFVTSGDRSYSYLTVLWHNGAASLDSRISTFGHTFVEERFDCDFVDSTEHLQYPYWVERFNLYDMDALLYCRTAKSYAVRTLDVNAETELGLLSYVRFEGDLERDFEHNLIRGLSIAPGDFMLELRGVVFPFYGIGMGYDVIDNLDVNQSCRLGLRLMGERGLLGGIYLQFKGNMQGLGGYSIVADLGYYDTSQWVYNENSVGVETSIMRNGVNLDLQVERVSDEWFFRYRLAGDWVELLRLRGIRIPLLVSLYSQVSDVIGGKGMMRINWRSIKLLGGNIYYKNVDYPVLFGRYASVLGGIGFKDYFPDENDGSIVVVDSLALPYYLHYA